ncbi:Mrp/NBP35 family ATP-binding protein [bacterium]|nr:Mrp/NBP35 family ATP-binding protein [bacterium]
MSGPGPQGASPHDNQDARIADTLRNVRYKLLVMSGKGGVGKSTVAVNLAVALARDGFGVGLLDIDLHGPSVPYMLGVQSMHLKQEGDKLLPIEYLENLKVLSIANLLDMEDRAVIWRGPMKIGAIRQFLADVKWGELDYMIIDVPPGTGDEPLTAAQTFTGVQAIVVTTPQDVALADVRKSLAFCRKVEMPILGVVENMSGYDCPQCGHHADLFSTGGGERLAAREGIEFLGRLPLDPEVVRSGDLGRPYLAATDATPAARAFRDIARRVEDITAKQTPKLPGVTRVAFVSKKNGDA